ncbi:lipid droplet-associated protein [Pseudonocardia benzenivorans]|uniref:Lipid droplet-associated protein n=1 Tax=Pseudonocardia benzenivorans TaxID=228005 RepID=A0ABW3VI22_9PSEU
MKPLPMPVRIAAGLVATAVEQARDLPRLVTELPVTAVSQALQVSMRVQQRVTELAIKGDRALGALRPVPETPSWATFDDEEPATVNGASVTSMRGRATFDDDTEDDDTEDDDTEPAAGSTGGSTGGLTGGSTLPADPEDPIVAADPATEVAAETIRDGAAEDDGPAVLPGYAGMSIPQLRGRLRALDVDELRALLQWEINHGNRPPYVTMLGNRIVTMTEG